MKLSSYDFSDCNYLRRFKPEDAVPMLNMMHDDSVNQFFRFDGKAKTLEQIQDFIQESNSSDSSFHLAMTTDDGDYVGSVSLKDVDFTHNTAEYAVISAAAYHGKGYAYKASMELLNFAFNELKLHSVFLDVYSNNERAIAFYKKLGFSYEGESRECLFIRGEYRSLKWFRILSNEFKYPEAL
jgi:diamine N-acetyltransferase